MDSPNWFLNPHKELEEKTHPGYLVKMKSGYVVLGNTQFLKGYCLLIAYPKVKSLNQLENEARLQFLEDMGHVGDAINEVFNPRRLNYSILGNSNPYLHAHVFPRYDEEPAEKRRFPVWLYSNQNWRDENFKPENIISDQEKEALINALKPFSI